MELIKYVRKDTQIQDDVISNFEDALKRWSMTTRRLRPALSAVRNMVEAFTQIVTTPHADPRIPMKAATCLCYLDSTDQVGIDKLFTYLHDKDSYTKKHALEILAKHLKMYDQVIIQATIDLLCTAPVYKHRLVALETLINIGLEGINENNMTEQIFQTLREKLWNEPHLVVRQRVAMTVNYLRMKRKMWEVVEKQLGHKDEENRSQAVISLGVLGVGSTRMLRTLLEMTEIDPSDQVQFQIIRTFARLHLNDIRVKRNLCNRQQRAGPLGREASKALKNFVNLPCEPKQSVSTLM
uniref:Condensin complex subunit 1 C-terminal domain-containing protein n=1 Tax=Callorhinchus milii TaxID=7868 RepID=V9KYY5_CALMI